MADSDRRELTNDKGILALAQQRTTQQGIWTALPGYITKFDPATNTCEVQPTISVLVLDQFGVQTWVQLPLLVDCPVIFPSGGGFTLTFPIAVNDECLVVFSARCIDSWFQSGGVQVQAELRMHDLSDGFVLPGPFSLPRVPAGISTTDVQLRNNAGTSHVSIKANGDIDLVAPGNATVTAPTITLNGNVTINGTLVVTDLITGEDFKPTGTPPPLGTDASYLNHKHDVLHGTDLGPPVSYP